LRPGICSQHPIKADEIEANVWDWIADIIASDARLDEVIEEMAAKAEDDIGPLQDELADISRMLEKAEGKIARLIKGFGDADDEIIASALKREINDTRKMQTALERRRGELEIQIANTKINPLMKEEIKAIARQVRERVKEGGTAENKRDLIEALDFQGQLIDDEQGGVKLRVSCGLGSNLGIIRIDSQSYLRERTNTKRLILFIGEFALNGRG